MVLEDLKKGHEYKYLNLGYNVSVKIVSFDTYTVSAVFSEHGRCPSAIGKQYIVSTVGFLRNFHVLNKKVSKHKLTSIFV